MNRNKFVDENQNIKDIRRMFVEVGQIWVPNDRRADFDGVYIDRYADGGGGDAFMVHQLYSIQRLMDEQSLKLQTNRFTGIEVDQQMRPRDNPALIRLTELNNMKSQYMFVRDSKTTPMNKSEVVAGYTQSLYDRNNISW